jgi:GNAT superfamily N-acetyltransferase
VGRIAAIVDRLHQEYHGDRLGFFGFFEVPDHTEVARVLVEAACEWLAARGCDRLRGPMNPSMKGEFGVQVTGHGDPPFVMMAHTPPYYERLLLEAGLAVAKSFYAFRLDTRDVQQRREHWEHANRLGARILRRHPELRVTTADPRRLGEQLRAVNTLANRVRHRIWGFVPLTDAELDDMVAQLRRVIDPETVVLVYREQELVGYAIAVPDVNWALGRTWGRSDWIRTPQLLYWLRRTPRLRTLALGADERYRSAGVATLLLSKILERGTSRYRDFEISWIVEDNLASLRAVMRILPMEVSKMYRLYEGPTDRSDRPSGQIE